MPTCYGSELGSQDYAKRQNYPCSQWNCDDIVTRRPDKILIHLAHCLLTKSNKFGDTPGSFLIKITSADSTATSVPAPILASTPSSWKDSRRSMIDPITHARTITFYVSHKSCYNARQKKQPTRSKELLIISQRNSTLNTSSEIKENLNRTKTLPLYLWVV